MLVNWTLTLEIAGVATSVAVGFGTFYVSEKRARRRRWEGAKDIILRDLSKALGEGNVPKTPVILATVRSVLRDHNATDLAVVTLEEIRDDLLRQVTADPFLDAERRSKLQNQVLEVQQPSSVEVEATRSTEKPLGWLDRVFVTSIFVGLFASVISGTAFLLVRYLTVPSRTANWPELRLLLLLPILLVASILIGIARDFFIRPRDRDD